MDAPSNNTRQYLLWWITSIASSVVCCSVLFVIFAGYLVDIKEKIALNQIHIEALEQRVDLMISEVRDLYRRAPPQSPPFDMPAPGLPADQPAHSQPPAPPGGH